MKLRLCILGPNLRLEEIKALPKNFSDEKAFPEKTTSIYLGVSGPVERWNTDFLFEYDIFPRAIMRFDSEWRKKKREMAIGDVILQRALLPPIGFGLCIEFAVRICAIVDDDGRRGFAYETLAGHVESGVSEFYIKSINGELVFTIRTFSQPGHWMSRLGKGIVTLPYQAWCTRRALEHVRRRFHEENESTGQPGVRGNE